MAWVYLTLFLVFSVTIHGAGFYLFQVVYPAPSRLEPDQDALTILDRSDSRVRALLLRLRDRTIYLEPPSDESDVRLSLGDHQVRFTSTFQETDLKLVEPIYPWSLDPRWIDPDASEELEIPMGRTEHQLFSMDAALSNRGAAPWSILEDYLDYADSIPAFRANLRVNAQGDVKVLELDGEIGKQSEDELVRVIESTLRFNPGSEAIIGWLDVWART